VNYPCIERVLVGEFCQWATSIQTAPGPGSVLAVPSDGTITAWRVRGSASGSGQVALLVLRPFGGGRFTAVGKSSPATAFDGVTANSAYLQVLPGDRIAVVTQNDFSGPIYDDGTAEVLAVGALGATLGNILLIAPGSSTAAPQGSIVDEELLVNATVEIDPPAVSTMGPTSGSACGGTTVTISGLHLAGAMAVTFGGVSSATFSGDNLTMTATAPPHTAAPVDVQVQTAGGISPGTPLAVFTYVTDYAAVRERNDMLRALLGAGTCGGEPVPKKIRGKLLGKVRAATGKANAAETGKKAAAVAKKLGKADRLVVAAQAILAAAGADLAADCTTTGTRLLAEMRQCLGVSAP